MTVSLTQLSHDVQPEGRSKPLPYGPGRVTAAFSRTDPSQIDGHGASGDTRTWTPNYFVIFIIVFYAVCLIAAVTAPSGEGSETFQMMGP